jgi:hypothetical protein
MKIAYLASTAIVSGQLLFASSVAAGSVKFSIGGDMEFQMGITDQDVDLPDRGYDFLTSTEIHFNFRGEADNGLRYGAQIQLEVDQGGTGNSDEVWTWLEGNWGRIQLGDKDGAESQMTYDAGLTQSGAGGIDGDLDDWFVNVGDSTTSPDVSDSGDATKITYYTPRIAGIQVGASLTPQTDSVGQNVANDDPDVNGKRFENHIGLGLNFQETLNAVDIGVSLTGGFADAVGQDYEDLANWVVGGYIEYSNFTFGASYGDNGDSSGKDDGSVDDDFFYDIGLGYSKGPWEASIGYLHSEFKQGNTDDEFDNFAISGEYSYAPGLQVYFDLMFASADSAGNENNDGTVLLLGHELSF